jgi:hypothetical protein
MRRGVDFDGTLAVYDGWHGAGSLGEPIPMMVDRVKRWLAQGDEVVIVTARAHPDGGEDADIAIAAITEWCIEVFGKSFEVTCMKDPKMEEIWDDRGVRIETNTGRIADQADIVDQDINNDSDSIGKFLGV